MRWDFSSAIICPYFFISTLHQSSKHLFDCIIELVTLNSCWIFIICSRMARFEDSCWPSLWSSWSTFLSEDNGNLRASESFWELQSSCRSHGKDIGSPFPPYLELGYLPRPRHLLRTRSWCCQPRPISWNKSLTLKTHVTGHFAYALYPLLLPPCHPSSLPYPRIPGSALWKEFVKSFKQIMIFYSLHFDPIQINLFYDCIKYTDSNQQNAWIWPGKALLSSTVALLW